jgi:hypothetical protein
MVHAERFFLGLQPYKRTDEYELSRPLYRPESAAAVAAAGPVAPFADAV